jgi:diacylglycerol kinase (ATP)
MSEIRKEAIVRAADLKRVRVLINPKSGLRTSFDSLRSALTTYWDGPDRDLAFQFISDVADSERKVRRAIDDGIDLLLVAGGDGTVSSIGRMLVGTSVCLGTIPTGSGNGLARHFGVPLAAPAAAQALAAGKVRPIDVGLINDRAFLITASLAWDAAIVESFDKIPMRGILPYVFAGVYQFFEHKPQALTVTLDQGEPFTIDDPLVFTIANLSQYGGGAMIAPKAEPDDGILELVIVRRKDLPMLVPNLGKLIGGDIGAVPQVVQRRFRSMVVTRRMPAPIQQDGELVDSPPELHIVCKHKAINMLVPEITL